MDVLNKYQLTQIPQARAATDPRDSLRERVVLSLVFNLLFLLASADHPSHP